MVRNRRRLKRLLQWMVGRDPNSQVQVRMPHDVLGEHDVYSVCPVGIVSGSVAYSFGVGEDISFDLALIERFGVTVHAFDPTPRSLRWIDAQSLPPSFCLHPYGLADVDGVARFNPPKKESHVSYSTHAQTRRPEDAVELPVRRLCTIMAELGHRHIDILKLDIEGAEYAVVPDMLSSRCQVSQILVEFHHHLKGIGLSATRRAVRQLNDAGYRIFDISETGREYSFIRL